MGLNKGTETQTEAKKEQIIRPASKTDARKKKHIYITLKIMWMVECINSC
jgi:hypothetical protein